MPSTFVKRALQLAGALVSLQPAIGFADDMITNAWSGPEVTPFCLVMYAMQDSNMPPGFTAKYKVKLQNTLLTTSMYPVVTANGDVDIGQCSGTSTVFNAWDKGAHGLFAFAFGAKAPVFQMVVAPGINTLADLKGKRIGIPGIQSAAAEGLQMILKRGANLLPQRDYDFLDVGSNSAVTAALLSKRIDAAGSYPPYSYDMEKRGFKILADESTYVPEYTTGMQIANRAWVQKNHEVFIRLLKAMLETGAWFKDPANETAVEAWFTQHISASPLDADTAKRVYDFYIKQNRLALDGSVTESTVRANLDILKERGYITDAQIPPLGQVVDFSYLNEARRELGLPPAPEFAK
ncbi:MAG TPA: ABC transporter substrate-binding protein [Beijerinckiaceae bacterium]|nr:ABC transporter substrate-binding protein [Beijerinckiaceae bacterium]